jgi:hypothetical protein
MVGELSLQAIFNQRFYLRHEFRVDKNIDVLAVIHKRSDFTAEDLP